VDVGIDGEDRDLCGAVLLDRSDESCDIGRRDDQEVRLRSEQSVENGDLWCGLERGRPLPADLDAELLRLGLCPQVHRDVERVVVVAGHEREVECFRRLRRRSKREPLRRTAGMKAPMTVPAIRPVPPKRLVPPMTTAAIAARLSCVWAAIDAVAKRLTSMTPTIPASRPISMYSTSVCRRTL